MLAKTQTLILSVGTHVTDTHTTALRLHLCWQKTDANSIVGARASQFPTSLNDARMLQSHAK